MTLEELKTIGKFEFPATMNDFYTSAIEAATKACMSFIGAETGAVTEFFEGGGRTYALTHHPVSGIVSVSVGGNVLGSGAYRYESRSSKVVLKTQAGGEVEIAYTCAFAEDIHFKTCVAMVVRNMDQQRIHAGVKQASFAEGGQETYDDDFIPTSVMKALSMYQKGHVL